ncbi:hypothetical protein ACHAWF_001626, partial [Thalassiosira exigua]
ASASVDARPLSGPRGRWAPPASTLASSAASTSAASSRSYSKSGWPSLPLVTSDGSSASSPSSGRGTMRAQGGGDDPEPEPEPKADVRGRTLSASPGARASGRPAGERRWPFRSPFDPRGGGFRGRPLLPVHSRPNAELSALVERPNGTAYPCPEGLVYVSDHVLPDNIMHPLGRKIPRVLHVTSKSRCMSRVFAYNAGRWVERLGSKYLIYVHNDNAVDQFLYERRWMEFGELKEVASWVTAGLRHGGGETFVVRSKRGACGFETATVAMPDETGVLVLYGVGCGCEAGGASDPRYIPVDQEGICNSNSAGVLWRRVDNGRTGDRWLDLGPMRSKTPFRVGMAAAFCRCRHTTQCSGTLGKRLEATDARAISSPPLSCYGARERSQSIR